VKSLLIPLLLFVLPAGLAWSIPASPGLLLYERTAMLQGEWWWMLGEPAMQTYGGLSGLATGVVVLLALTELGRRGQDRAWGWGLLILVAAKIAFDATQTSALFAGFGTQAVRSSVLAHAAGVVAALALYFVRRIQPRLVSDQPSPIQTP
jgi:hypothetical protein